MDFIAENFKDCIWLAVLLIAMCPTLESKIAIPFAMNSSIWGDSALSPLTAFLVAFLGSIIPSYIVMIIIRKLKRRTTGFISSKLFSKYIVKGSSIDLKGSEFKKYLALAGFVALPIPLTGVWTGSIIAGISNLNLNYSFISIFIGGALSAGAVTILCSIFSNSISYIFMITLLILIIFMLIDLLIPIFKSKVQKK